MFKVVTRTSGPLSLQLKSAAIVLKPGKPFDLERIDAYEDLQKNAGLQKLLSKGTIRTIFNSNVAATPKINYTKPVTKAQVALAEDKLIQREKVEEEKREEEKREELAVQTAVVEVPVLPDPPPSLIVEMGCSKCSNDVCTCGGGERGDCDNCADPVVDAVPVVEILDDSIDESVSEKNQYSERALRRMTSLEVKSVADKLGVETYRN